MGGAARDVRLVRAPHPEGAIATIAPAFKIVEMRGPNMREDMPLAIADNVAQRAFVHGAAIPRPSYADWRYRFSSKH